MILVKPTSFVAQKNESHIDKMVMKCCLERQSNGFDSTAVYFLFTKVGEPRLVQKFLFLFTCRRDAWISNVCVFIIHESRGNHKSRAVPSRLAYSSTVENATKVEPGTAVYFFVLEGR